MALAVLLGGTAARRDAAAHGARGTLVVGVGVGAVARGHAHHGVGVAGIHRAALQPLLAAEGRSRSRRASRRCSSAAASPPRACSSSTTRDARATATPTSPASAATSASSSSTRCSSGSAQPEVEAVLAHELGHFRLKHVRKRAAAVGRCTTSSASRCSAGSPAGRTSTPRSACRGPRRTRRCCCSCWSVPAFTFFITPARLAVVAPPRVRGGRVRHALRERGGARDRAREAAPRQRQHAHPGPGVRRLLLLSSAAARAHLAPACRGGRRGRLKSLRGCSTDR